MGLLPGNDDLYLWGPFRGDSEFCQGNVKQGFFVTGTQGLGKSGGSSSTNVVFTLNPLFLMLVLWLV